MTVGSGAALGGLAALYVLTRLRVLPVAVIGLLVVIVVIGIGVVGWGGLLAPRVAEARLKAKFKPRELPSAHPGTGDDKAP